MGGFGSPLKTLDTARPVKDEVADAFINGPRLWGLLSSSAQVPFYLSLVVRKFDADKINGRTARIDLTKSMFDRESRVVCRDHAVDSEADMKFLETGVLVKITDLQALAQTVLDHTVDRMLDNPQFRAAIARSAGR